VRRGLCYGHLGDGLNLRLQGQKGAGVAPVAEAHVHAPRVMGAVVLRVNERAGRTGVKRGGVLKVCSGRERG